VSESERVREVVNLSFLESAFLSRFFLLKLLMERLEILIRRRILFVLLWRILRILLWL
jgi:hypothetical protein